MFSTCAVQYGCHFLPVAPEHLNVIVTTCSHPRLHVNILGSLEEEMGIENRVARETHGIKAWFLAQGSNFTASLQLYIGGARPLPQRQEIGSACSAGGWC